MVVVILFTIVMTVSLMVFCDGYLSLLDWCFLLGFCVRFYLLAWNSGFSGIAGFLVITYHGPQIYELYVFMNGFAQ